MRETADQDPDAEATPMATMSAVARACSATPDTGMTVKAITRTIVSGLARRAPAKNTA